MSEKKISKCEEGEEKKCKCRISGVRKKNERKVPEKKSKCLQWKLRLKLRKKIRDFYSLGLYPLVGRYVD